MMSYQEMVALDDALREWRKILHYRCRERYRPVATLQTHIDLINAGLA